MKLIHSFWSKPSNGTHHWLSVRDFLYSQVISAAQARKTYGNIHLVTDTAGAKLLVDAAGIAYDSISTVLDAGDAVDRRWWVYGKLKAYREQTEAFLHLDADVYLWDRLPEAVTGAPIFAQSYEEPGREGFELVYDRPLERITAALSSFPEAWQHTADRRAVNMGIFGGSRLDVIHEYADYVLSLISDPNHNPLADVSGKWTCVFLEQQLVYAFAKRAGIDITPLFATEADMKRTKVYTHMMGRKTDERTSGKLRARMEADHADVIDRIDALAKPLDAAVGKPKTPVRPMKKGGGCDCGRAKRTQGAK